MKKHRSCNRYPGWIIYEVVLSIGLLALMTVGFLQLIMLIEQGSGEQHLSMKKSATGKTQGFLLIECMIALGIAVTLSLMLSMFMTCAYQVLMTVNNNQIIGTREMLLDVVKRDLMTADPYEPLKDQAFITSCTLDNNGQPIVRYILWSINASGGLTRSDFAYDKVTGQAYRRQQSVLRGCCFDTLTFKPLFHVVHGVRLCSAWELSYSYQSENRVMLVPLLSGIFSRRQG